MLKSIDKRCNKCNRVTHRSFIELDGADWEIREQYKTVETFRSVCWPCSCKDEKMKYGQDSPKARHIEIINFSAEKSGGCGCG